MTKPDSNIVSTQWLHDHLENPKIVVLDATLKNRPNGERINQPPLKIKGAQEFNYDTEICDQHTQLPHMLPSVEHFESAARDRGISPDSLVVIYDAMGIFSSPRAWWMFKIMGHQNVVILNGGLPKWLEEQRPSQTTFSQPSTPGTFKAAFKPELLFNAQQVLDAIGDSHIQTIDARSRGRFNATEPEPRPGMKGGHIPGSSCLPFTELLENGQYKPIPDLKRILAQTLKDQTSHHVFTCGSGVTASIISLAADECGYPNLSVYDGSWSEWANRQDLPIET